MQTAPGIYQRRIFPWLNDKLNSDPGLVRIRADVIAAATGRTIEIGFGTGLNLPHYPSRITALVGIEPSQGMLDRARSRIDAVAFPVEISHAAAETLPMPDGSFDTAVSVLTLCSVADPVQVLAELRRVLRDNGRLIVFEHGLADVPDVAKWQVRLDWLQGKLACGCHLTRPMVQLLRRAGFDVTGLRQFYAPKMPRTHGWLTVGVASKVS